MQPIPFPLINTLIMAGTVAVQVAVVALVLSMLVPHAEHTRRLLGFLSRHAVPILLFVSLGAVLGTLYYSEAADFLPCMLCWYQRVALYPIPLLLLVGWRRRDRGVFASTAALAATGLAIAMYHNLLPFLSSVAAFCNVLESASCLTEYVRGFGYITIPVMSFSAFAFMLLVSYIALQTHENKYKTYG